MPVKLLAFLLVVVVMALLSWLAPAWLLSLATIAAGSALVVLGLMVLWRAGLMSFGQALYFATGAYVVALIVRSGRVSDIALLLLCAGLASGCLAYLVGILLSRYREIFFAMLSLAFSMILYGYLVQAAELGSSDGLHVKPASILGHTPSGPAYTIVLFMIAWLVALGSAIAIRWYLNSIAGRLTNLIAENEIRIEYLGFSVRLVHTDLTLAGALAGVGGGLTALSIGHVDPTFAYWTTSGEFVFVTILAGPTSVTGALLGTMLFVLFRSTAMSIIPYAWQFCLGAALLFTILFVPNGIGSVAMPRTRPTEPSS